MPVYDTETMTRVRRAIAEVEKEEYLTALVSFAAIRDEVGEKPFPTNGLSHYALCVALVEKDYEKAIEMAEKAIELQFNRPEHYLNLSKIYVCADDRKAAVEVADRGLEIAPEDPQLLAHRNVLGIRQPPPVPFLDRSNPLNKSIGRARRAKEQEDESRESDDE